MIRFASKALVVAAIGSSSAAIADPLLTRPADSCGTVQQPSVFAKPTFANSGQRIIYLNRFGGNYNLANAATDSATNTANAGIVSQIGTRMITIPPMESGFDWPAVRDCVVAAYKPYNVRIVESEPTTGDYVEAVVGGTGTEIGFGANQLFGIASADNFCAVTERGIAFTFSRTHQGVPQKDKELCATIAHEVGHLLALEHEVEPTDLLSYVLVSQTSTKLFVNGDKQCGTEPSQPSQCSCGSGTTNSSARLTQFVGGHATETNAPTLTVDSPKADDRVGPTFEVNAHATDVEGMADVLLYIDGNEVANSAIATADAYKIAVKGIAEGTHALSVVARDLAGNLTKKDLSIKVAKLDVGETCVGNDACKGNLCAMAPSGNFCTQTCEVANDTCPAGFACDATLSVCVGSDGGGCCSSSQGDVSGAVMLAFGVVVLVRRRRR